MVVSSSGRSPVAARTSPTFRRRQLARRIRQLRESAGLTQGEAASGLDMSTSALSRKETGDAATSVHELRSMLDLYDHYDPDLLDLARAARRKGWWREYGIEDRGYVDLETEAFSVREVHLSLVPGLLQTSDYMRCLFATGLLGSSPELVEQETAARLVRQRRLDDREQPLQLHAVIAESALHNQVGGPRVMARQLEDIVERGAMSTVTVQVLPRDSGGCAAVQSSFVLLDYAEPEQPDILHFEHVAGSFQTEAGSAVRAAGVAFQDVCDRALSHEDSLRFVERVAAELEGGRCEGEARFRAAVAAEQPNHRGRQRRLR